jgi:hypothetical protein
VCNLQNGDVDASSMQELISSDKNNQLATMACRAPCDVDVGSQRENITSISGDFGEAVDDVKPLMIVPCWSEREEEADFGLGQDETAIPR